MQGTSITRAVAALKKGGVVVYPTETAYGLGADATDARAVAEIFKMKGRARSKSVIVLMQDIAMVRRYARVTRAEELLMKRYWPGALTIVVRAKRSMVRADSRARRIPVPALARGVVAKDGTIAVRVSSNAVARALVRSLGRPLVSTSANRAGGKNPYTISAVRAEMGAECAGISVPFYMYNGGALPQGNLSTIVRIERGALHVIRRGAVRVFHI